jgi:hypothetical protein
MAMLAQNDLYIRSDKCHWMKKSLDYLGFTIQGSTNLASGGIKPSIKKIQAVTDWEVPKNVRHVQSFLGFTNFYRRFIRNYSSIASPLYNLTEKGKTFYWSTACNHAFGTLKKCLTTAPLLVTPRTGLDATFVISTDASNKGIGDVLLQEQTDGSLSDDIHKSSYCLHNITIYLTSREGIFLYGMLRCNAYVFYFILGLDGDFGGFKIMRLSDVEMDIEISFGCKEIKRLGVLESEHILSLVNRKHSMGWWVREGQSLAG